MLDRSAPGTDRIAGGENVTAGGRSVVRRVEGRPVRVGALLCALVVAGSVAGCTDHPAGRSTSSAGAGHSAAVGTTSAGGLVSAADYWTAHPQDAPAGVPGSTLLLNLRATGSRTVDLPGVAGYRSLVLVLTCAPGVHYRLQLRDGGGNAGAWTEGESCGGAFINSYRTPALDSAHLPVAIQIDVPAGTDYYVVVYGDSAL
jgi:hypothetical protein